MEFNHPKFAYTISLSKEELRLIGLGLIRKLEDHEDIAMAADMNVKIMEGRVRVHQQGVDDAKRVLDQAKTICTTAVQAP